MESVYKKILPEEVFISIFDREPTEAELWQGISGREWTGNRPTGNNFIDLFASLLRKHGHRKPFFYARLMGVTEKELSMVIKAMSGISAAEWIWRYLHLASCELLKETDMSIGEVSKRLGFSSLNTFTRYFYRMEGMYPSDFRYR
jgi:methylphosphotriester-DNA--protein-cysteine methyltransferase